VQKAFAEAEVDVARVLTPSERDGPGYTVLARALRGAILDGRLPLRARLPSERALAGRLGVSRTTTAAAYDVLRSEGFIESLRGSGSRTALPTGGTVDREVLSGEDTGRRGETIDLTVASLAAPAAMVEAVSRAALDLRAHLGGHGYDPCGLPSLRCAVAAQLTARGVPTDDEEILVTSGAQSSITLLLDALAAPGDAVLVEVPTYPNALEALRRAGTRLLPVAVDERGWQLDRLTSAFRRGLPRLAYTICDFHNPTGLLMPDAQRAALVAEAERAGTQVIVDETFAELDLAPHRARPAPLAAHGPDGRVLTIGSMSKAYWGGLRVGWIRAPQALVRRLARVRAARDMATPVLEQLVALHLLAVSDEVKRERRALLIERRDALVAALRRELPQWRFRVPRGGLCLWVELDRPQAEALSDVAEPAGVRIVPGPTFGVEGTLHDRIRLPYTQPPAVLDDAVVRLAGAWRRLQMGAGRRRDMAMVT
jgi:DNA-binding transcriptional MocR family regulator